ncbi:bifunctional nicotinamide-nucleotide adenylyltransferase/Nudix hydroxylase [Massilia sp. CCM 8734]|uniref:bifunctional nicotinamide-nucleotide adenylyltransferase/Nudix hydroxylase n=1 Tax=Massilia sp. CCM 8734 TaxID=2609283 RepID=UPI00142467BC|nr:bifunctional nicotinamide-nucleotide adenylyltransferase/Nudix hydroxylase [Massilia sp. CCM 8734]NHZ95992.1 NUDIX domain-containing protein [Massilia sp. CCM 8734]
MNTQTKQTSTDVAVLIGRFQPFHRGHVVLLQRALVSAPHVVLVLGSSFQARNAKNPFTWEERAAMIGATLTEQDRARVSFVAVRDYYDDSLWSAAVRKAVAQSAPDAAHVALVGHFKDASSYYLNHFPKWENIVVESERAIDATCVRRVFFEAEDLDISLSVLDDMVPHAVRQYLKAWALLPHYPALVEEHRRIVAYKTAWKSAPYPPIFTTADAVVVSGGNVLLIRRGGFPGKGQWAVPGGFVEQRERLLHAAIRELAEETKLALLGTTLEGMLVDVKVFDHPDRSQRGRTITHAHFFDLQTENLPPVEASDDASHAAWIPIVELAGMEDQFFEDHFHILDSFLSLSEELA